MATQTSGSQSHPQSQSQSHSRSSAPTDVLRAQIRDVRVLSALLRPIAFSAVANFSLSHAGIQVTTESDRSVQAVAYVSCSVFDQFDFTPPEHEDGDGDDESGEEPALDFDLRLQTLLECINVFGGANPSSSSSSSSSWAGKREAGGGNGLGPGKDPSKPGAAPAPPPTGMRLRWRGQGYPLILLLEERDVSTRCELATFEPGFGLGLAYHHDDTQAQAILPSEYLLDALQSFDAASCNKVTLLFSNCYRRAPEAEPDGNDSLSVSGTAAPPPRQGGGQPMLKIISDGDFGTAEVSARGRARASASG